MFIKQIFAHQCSERHRSQQPKDGNNSSIHQWMSGWIKCHLAISALIRNCAPCYNMDETWKQLKKARQKNGTSLVVQWLGIHLPMQGTQIWSLVQEDATFCGVIKPKHPNDWVGALEPVSCNCWACVPRAHASQQKKPSQWEALTLQLESSPHSTLEKAHTQWQRSSTAK